MTPLPAETRERIESIRNVMQEAYELLGFKDISDREYGVVCALAKAIEDLTQLAEEERRDSPLAQALDDGQEVRMFKSANYYVLISGDCHAEGRSKDSLSQAIEEATRLYAEWMARTE